MEKDLLVRRLGAILSAIAFVIFSALSVVYEKDLNYPYLQIDVADKATYSAETSHLMTTMLMAGVGSRNQCESTLRNITGSILSSCQQCKVVTSRCLEELSTDLDALLSDGPIPDYSARLPNGVALYQSTDTELARQACQESERRSDATRAMVRCYPPNAERTATSPRERSVFPNAWQVGDVWTSLAWVALATLLIQVLRPLVPLLGSRAIVQPRWKKQMVIMLADVAFLEFSLWAAFAVRLDIVFVPEKAQFPLFLIVPIIAVPVFIRFGLYRAVMRYLGLKALGSIAKAIILYTALLTLVIYLLSLPNIPRSVPLIHGALAMLITGGSRAIARHWLSTVQSAGKAIGDRKRVVIYGAGSAGIQLAAALGHSREMIPVALVDDDPILHRRQIAGLNVCSPKDLPRLIQQEGIAEVLLAIPSASRERRNRIIAQLEPLPIHVRTLPGVAELAEGKIRTSNLREIDIEDLLGRDPVAPDPKLLSANIVSRAVMVTGAGGSIGSELCRQILAQGPKALVLYEVNEFALYTIEHDLRARSRGQTLNVWPILGSVCDEKKMKRVIAHFGIQTIYHAAAYKHVPMVEKNPCEGASNNVLGTWKAANAALETGVETFVLISTDKAVRPTNTMGTTKRLAEMVLQSLAAEFPQLTRFTMVRFGNVLGSSGSVVPLFREQIRLGGPVTVTDPRIIRYFMTIPEAAQLVIQAGAMGRDGDVFVLDMGEPVKILDLARRMINLSGLSVCEEGNPEGDIEIKFTGLRPGEKLYEELLIGDNVSATFHPRIRRANEATLALSKMRTILADISAACSINDSGRLREVLLDAVNEFSPQCGNEDLLAASICAINGDL